MGILKAKYLKAGPANAVLAKLEQEIHSLGGPAPSGDFIHNIGQVNSAIERATALRDSLKAGKAAPSKPAAPAAPAVTKSAPAPMAPPMGNPTESAPASRPSRKQLERISTEVFRSHILNNGEDLGGLTDHQLFSRIEKLAYQDFLQIPGMRSDEAIAADGVYRPETPQGGIARVLRAARKEHLQKILGNR